MKEWEKLCERRKWELGLLVEACNVSPRKESHVVWRSKSEIFRSPTKPEPTKLRDNSHNISGIEETWPKPFKLGHFHSLRGRNQRKKAKTPTTYIQAFKSLFNKSISNLVPPKDEVPELTSECMPRRELDNSEVHELPAVEPVGFELLTPRDETDNPATDWPLPLSPLPALFAMTEIRDERTGADCSPKHQTFYHP
jgi:hypothetical protein